MRLGNAKEAVRCGYRATRCTGTVSIGHDLVGRAHSRLGDRAGAVAAFQKAVQANGNDPMAANHLMLALYAAGEIRAASEWADRRMAEEPTDLIPRALRGLESDSTMEQFAREARMFVGEDDFELIETSIAFAQLGLIEQAARILRAGCVQAVPPSERGSIPLYYLAWYASLLGDDSATRKWLDQAAGTDKPFEFASRPETV